jgi:hypothetical protein
MPQAKISMASSLSLLAMTAEGSRLDALTACESLFRISTEPRLSPDCRIALLRHDRGRSN